MTTVGARQELPEALEDLARLLAVDAEFGDAPDADFVFGGGLRATVSELQRRLREDRIRVLVVGESKRGKSTFTNALIGAPILPMGVTPLTAVATTVTYGNPPCAVVSARGLPDRIEPLEALAGLVTESGNPGNRRGLTAVVVRFGAPLLADGIELVDTPGTGSVYEANTAEAEIAYRAMDAAIFVLSADPPISATERELLTRILPSSVATFVVLNKADRLAESELAEARRFTAETVEAVAGRPLPIYACSARQALDVCGGKEPGVVTGERLAWYGLDAFVPDFREFLRTDRASLLLTSLRRQAACVIAQLLDEVTISERAAELARDADLDNVRLFREHLDGIDRGHKDAGDLVAGEARRLLAELNSDAERIADDVARSVTSTVRSWFSRSGSLTNAELEAGGLRFGSEVAEREAESWRTARAEMLQTRLDELDSRLRGDLNRDLADLRPEAKRLFGVDLVFRGVDAALAPPRRFFYLPSRADEEAVGMLAAGVRHRLPGAAGRRRSERFVLAEMDRLGRQQVGRARADLQERLNTSSRNMRNSLADRYAAYGHRLRAALDAGTGMARSGAAQAEVRRADLHARRRRLTELLRRVRGDADEDFYVSPMATEVESSAHGR